MLCCKVFFFLRRRFVTKLLWAVWLCDGTNTLSRKLGQNESLRLGSKELVDTFISVSKTNRETSLTSLCVGYQWWLYFCRVYVSKYWFSTSYTFNCLLWWCIHADSLCGWWDCWCFCCTSWRQKMCVEGSLFLSRLKELLCMNFLRGSYWLAGSCAFVVQRKFQLCEIFVRVSTATKGLLKVLFFPLRVVL